jgi:hypothetical protein
VLAVIEAEWGMGAVGDSVIVDRCIDGDLAVWLVDSGETGGRGMGCGEPGDTRGLLDRR